MPTYPSGGWVLLNGPALDGTHFAQLFDPNNLADRTKGFVPVPKANNLNPITCKNYVFGPGAIASPAGYSAADQFPPAGPPPLTTEKRNEMFLTIADTAKTHGFNTDCISCHTETSLAHGFLQFVDPRIKQGVQPLTDFNLRNFGWGLGVQSGIPEDPEALRPTATRRTMNDTEAALKEINKRLGIGMP
jgi:hypothetical protein